jgi:hypothetical protein
MYNSFFCNGNRHFSGLEEYTWRVAKLLVPAFCMLYTPLITGTRIPNPLFPHLVPPAIMVWIFVWKYIFEPFIHILQHFVLQLSRSTNF